MAKSILLDARLFAGGADLSGASNKIELKGEVEEKDVTNYRSGGYRELLGGIRSAELAGEGQWEAGDPGKVDDAAWAMLGGRGPWTAAPQEATVGALAYLMYGLQCDYSLGDAVGEVAPWKASAKSSWPLVRGQVAHPPGTARTATGNGTAIQLGAVAAGQRLYAGLHVLSTSGTTPSLTVVVESDDATGMSSPTTQLTFNPAAAAGGQILRSAGDAITDTWFRARWTIAGTSPSFMFVVTLGIA